MKQTGRRTGVLLLLAAALCGCVLSASRAGDADAKTIVALKADHFEIPDSAGITMIRIAPGSFTMGSPKDEAGREADEAQRKVQIAKPFYMGATEITQEQYIPVVIPEYKPLFIRAAPWESSLPEVHSGGPFHTVGRSIADSSKHPMEGVTWDKAVEFCRTMTERERRAGRLPGGYVYRLPTEQEWEYACRAGTAGPFNTEGVLSSFAAASGLDTTQIVRGDRKPNAWGLYDMHGNVYEWCHDWYGESAAGPAGPPDGMLKVARGGCYLTGKLEGRSPDPPKDRANVRSAARGKFDPEFPLPILGFRIVLAPEMEKD